MPPVLESARTFWQLPDDELDRMLELSRAAGRVELKVVVPPRKHAATIAALGADLSLSPSRRVYYLDTLDLDLYRRNVVVRVRSNGGKPDDSVVKLRPIDPAKLPKPLRRCKDFAMEVDSLPGAYVCSGARKNQLSTGAVERAMRGRRSLRSLFTSAQLDLLDDYAGGFTIGDLTPIGPIRVRRRKIVPHGLKRPLLVEQWTLPTGHRILELSTKCAAADAVRVAARTAEVLHRLGVDLTCPQQTKTQTALTLVTPTLGFTTALAA